MEEINTIEDLKKGYDTISKTASKWTKDLKDAIDMYKALERLRPKYDYAEVERLKRKVIDNEDIEVMVNTRVEEIKKELGKEVR